MQEVSKSVSKVGLPDGIYCGQVGASNLTINSQDYFGIVIEMDRSIRTIALPVVVLVKDKVAYAYDRGFKLW
jgi:hypothetical protein